METEIIIENACDDAIEFKGRYYDRESLTYLYNCIRHNYNAFLSHNTDKNTPVFEQYVADFAGRVMEYRDALGLEDGIELPTFDHKRRKNKKEDEAENEQEQELEQGI